MTGTDRVYPDERAGPFPTPPRQFEDREGRAIEVRVTDGTDLDAITSMYVAFDPADRAQGIPPTGEGAIRDWLETVLAEGPDVAAWHDGDVVGHATLVPEAEADNDTEAQEPLPCELAIFVVHDYQGAGIGRVLLETMLGHGASLGIDRVWLTVERWNHAAVGLYESVGFERSGTDRFELEMSVRLTPPGGPETAADPPGNEADSDQTDSTG
jgi:GNAT superfamily N-acetyltransferase